MSVLAMAAGPLLVLVGPLTGEGLAPASTAQAADLVAKMDAAYAQVESYRTRTEVSAYRQGKPPETQRFLYTFQKPNRIRIEFETPHSGMVMTYPGKGGKVDVKPGGWASFLRLHLSPASSVLRSPSGQRIDQTDLGLLVRNIARSLTDQRRGEIGIGEQDGTVVIEVLADDHFLPGALTLYRFTIDEKSWLPVSVRESSPEGAPRRKVSFRDLVTTSGKPEASVPTVGESAGDEQRP